MMDDLLDMAHSELRSLITKAARGAGFTWGLAEEAGWAAEWLARRALPAGRWAADWLAQAIDGQPDPVTVGVGLADRLASGQGPIQHEDLPSGLVAPSYILPYLHVIAAHRGPMEITGPHGPAARVDAAGTVVFGPSWSDRTSFWHICSAGEERERTRAVVHSSVLECLERLALRTAVPASDRSRHNAGSMTSDND